jgi:hypothetical protein
MHTMSPLLQVIVAAVLLNVWLLRAGKDTPYRGGASHTMREEFAAYGLPRWSMYVIGAMKLTAAGLLIIGLWVPVVVVPTALVVGTLMLGAVAMHLRLHDSMKKTAPAFTMLVLATSLCLLPPG